MLAVGVAHDAFKEGVAVRMGTGVISVDVECHEHMKETIYRGVGQRKTHGDVDEFGSFLGDAVQHVGQRVFVGQHDGRLVLLRREVFLQPFGDVAALRILRAGGHEGDVLQVAQVVEMFG